MPYLNTYRGARRTGICFAVLNILGSVQIKLNRQSLWHNVYYHRKKKSLTLSSEKAKKQCYGEEFTKKLFDLI